MGFFNHNIMRRRRDLQRLCAFCDGYRPTGKTQEK
jgi:hypothetical protein